MESFLLQEGIDGIAPGTAAEIQTGQGRASPGVEPGLSRVEVAAALLAGTAVTAVLVGLSGSSTSRHRLR